MGAHLSTLAVALAKQRIARPPRVNTGRALSTRLQECYIRMPMKALAVITLTASLAGAAAAQQANPPPPASAHGETVTRGTVVDFPENDAAPEARAATAPLPQRGMAKQDVLAAFGAPETRFEPVGEPPITRWDYRGFRVFFERDLVLHAVVPGDFPDIRHRDQLAAGRASAAAN